MKELSIFIDESGDFGDLKEKPSYYLVTFVFHEQNKDIVENVAKLETSVKAADFICFMELLKIKREEKRLSRSEEKFFYKPQELKRTFLKTIEKKRLT